MPHTSPDLAPQFASHSSKLAELIELAKVPSSSRRRELLREVTDLFFADQGRSAAEMVLFDEVLVRLADDMEQEVRAELAQRFAAAQVAPRELLRRLSRDTIAVARPVLEQSPTLTQDDLMDVVRTRGQDHLRAVSGRSDLSETISDVIVERGDDTTLGVLIRNEAAVLSRTASEAVVDRAACNPELQQAVVERKNLPIDLLNDMYFVVEARLRERILQRNSEIDPATLQAALEVGRKRLATRDGALPADYAEAESHVGALKAQGGVSSAHLVAFLRNGERTRFYTALAQSTDIDFHTARRIVERRELDALAILCKAAGFDRALFLTFAVLILDPTDAMARANAYGRLYTDLPKDAALRTMRFWRIRRESGQAAA